MLVEFDADVWVSAGEARWHFVTLPIPCAHEVAEASEGMRNGFGSVRVRATIGSTTWETSIFPDTKADSFVLPCKKAVRKAEDLEEGDRVSVTLELLLGDMRSP